jgi:cyclase
VHYKRVIPCMDVDAGRVVKGTRFIDIRDAGRPGRAGGALRRRGRRRAGVPRHHRDLGQARDGGRAGTARAADDVFVPVHDRRRRARVADAHAVLDAGADKVSINSAAVARPALLGELARVFGAQCVVLAIDAKRRAEGWEVFVAGGRTPDRDRRGAAGRGRASSAGRARSC